MADWPFVVQGVTHGVVLQGIAAGPARNLERLWLVKGLGAEHRQGLSLLLCGAVGRRQMTVE